MKLLTRVTLALALALPGLPTAALAQQTTAGFSHEIVTRDAERLQSTIEALRDSEPGKRALAVPGADHRADGLAALAAGKDPRAAVRLLSLAVAGNAKDGQAWLGLAQAFLAVVPDPSRSGERYSLPSNASGAAWRAYETAADKPAKAEALAVLAQALERRSMWRPAIDALKAGVALDARPAYEAALAKLRAEHGFRVVDYKIDSDAATPRLCINFSERLASTAPGDLGKFTTLEGREPESLSAEGNQLCLDGLKHGTRYGVQVRAGLAAANGEMLAKTSDIAVYVRDRKPSLRLAGRAYVLPSRGQQGIPVTTVNTDKVAVEIFRVADRSLALAAGEHSFLKTLESWDLERVRETSAQSVWKGTLEVANRLNEDVITAIPVAEALGTPAAGVYIVATQIDGKAGGDSQLARAAQWFIVSDLGLTAFSGNDGLNAFARSLAATTPVAGLTLRLVARNNEILGTATTDAQGRAHFAAGLLKGEGSLAPRLLVAEGKGDYALLDLATGAFDLSDRGVKGRPAPGALDAYLYAERGVYRPGETVHLAGLVRTPKGEAADVAATLIIARPDGVEHRRVVLGDQGLGGRTFDLALGNGSMTGTWRAKLFSDPKAAPLAETAFLVEDFVPERLALSLAPESKVIRTGSTAKVAVSGRYLYGPPAADLALEGEVIVRAARNGVTDYPGYKFGIDGTHFPASRQALEGLARTRADGSGEVIVQLPRIKPTATPLEADVIVRLREPAGRAVERRTTLAIDPAMARVGIKPMFTGGQVGEGDAAAFDVLAVGADGKAMSRVALKWEIVRLDRRWQWYAHDGAWRYEPITTTRRVLDGTLDIVDGKAQRISFNPEWGRYRLDVTMQGGPRTTVLFQSGWAPGDSADSPEVLDVALDKGSYRGGETARLKINSKEAGRALVAVLAGGVATTREVDVPKGGAEVTLEVDPAWMPGAYVTATLYRALDERAKRMPSRAVGVAWLKLDPAPHTLDVKLDLPEKTLPGSVLTVPVKLTGLEAGEAARITVAAVDVGILSLTRYEAPAPERWFHAQRRLGVEMRDLYGRLIDGMRAERGSLRSGGDGTGGISAEGSPPVEAPLSLFSGLVTVGSDGTARVDFEMPDFNGRVRVMAVAWSRNKVGSAAGDVIVRDRVALTATAPRFLTLGDEARLAIDVHNIDGPDAPYRIGVGVEAGGKAAQSLAQAEARLAPAARHREAVTLKPGRLGTHTYDIRVQGPDGIEVRRRVALEVKPPAVGIRRTTVSSLAPGKQMVLSGDLFQDLIPSSARLLVTAGPTAAFDVTGLLSQLDRYPYGCAEQTTSRALPLLYVSELAAKTGIADASELKERIAKAIDRLAEMQDSSGAFGTWGPSHADLWLTAYVTDFLTRAREQGHTVREETYRQALDRLANHLAYAQDFEKGGEDRAYALYVLARNGRAPVGDLRYYVDARLDRFATPLAKAQLGAALAMLGDRSRASRAFEAALAGIEGGSAATLDQARPDYGSLVRDGAGILTLVAETKMMPDRQTNLARVLAAAFRQRAYTSTQEQAWMLLAARALGEAARTTSLEVGGAAHTGELARALTPADLAAGPVEIVNRSAHAVDTVVTVEGASLTNEPPIARGFTIERSYYTLDGQKVDLASALGGTAELAQNTRLVAVVTVKGDDPGGRVLVVDRLPAGLEVENPRLVDSGDVKSLPWLKQARAPEHTEFRDDRVVAAFSFFGSGNRAAEPEAVTATVAYMVRAVTPGSFVHPAASVEDMYRPERFARTAGGRLDVTQAK